MNLKLRLSTLITLLASGSVDSRFLAGPGGFFAYYLASQNPGVFNDLHVTFYGWRNILPLIVK